MRRFHWLSWFTLTVALLVSAILVVPGVQVREYHTDPVTGVPRPTYDVVFSHGWPFEYMRSPIYGGRFFSDRLEWIWHKAWPIHANTYDFRFGNLLTDLLICFVIASAAVLAITLWRKRESNTWYTFTIKKLLLGTALTALILYWYLSHATDRALEIASDDEFRTGGSGGVYPQIEYVYRGPKWLRRLAGKKWSMFCQHRTSVYLTPTIVDQLSVSHSPAINKIRRAESIECKCKSEQLVRILRNLQQLRHLTELKITLNDKSGFGQIDLSQIKTSTANKDEARSSLENNHHDQRPGLVSTEELARLTNLTSLSITKMKESGKGLKDGLSNLSRLSQLKSFELSASNLFIEDIQFISQFDSLERVKLQITATDEEQAAFESRHPQLRIKWQRLMGEGYLDDQAVLRRRFQQELEEDLNIIAYPQHLTIKEQLKSTHLKFLQNQVLGSYVEQLTCLELGKVDSVKTVKTLIRRCKKLESLQVPEVSFSTDELAKLPKGILFLGIRQGDLTIVDFQELISKLPTDGGLEIYQSSFTREQALKIHESAPDFPLTVYGLAPSGSSPIIYDW